MTACPVWPWLSPYNVCVTFAPPWSLADLTGSHDDSILLPIDQGWWWGLPLVSMLTANIIGAAQVKNLQSKNVVSQKTGKPNFRPTSGQIPKDWCVSLHRSFSIWLNSVLGRNLCGYFLSVCVTGFGGLERTSLFICLCSLSITVWCTEVRQALYCRKQMQWCSLQQRTTSKCCTIQIIERARAVACRSLIWSFVFENGIRGTPFIIEFKFIPPWTFIWQVTALCSFDNQGQ